MYHHERKRKKYYEDVLECKKMMKIAFLNLYVRHIIKEKTLENVVLDDPKA